VNISPSPQLQLVSVHEPDTAEPISLESGKPRLVNYIFEGAKLTALAPQSILTEILQHTNGWPKCIAGQLFENTADGKLNFIREDDDFFAWLFEHFDVEWKSVQGITKGEFVKYSRRNVEQYRGSSEFPHFPPIQGFYYNHPSVIASSGSKLDGLLDFFNPATPGDRELIKAFCMTLFWGGPPGQRPVFVFTTNDDGQSKGVGFGKTTMINLLSRLCDGKLDISNGETIEDFKKRLINSNLKFRLLVLDNLKSRKFSSAGLESLITADEITGHAMYTGNRSIPNYYTAAISVNGIYMSRDMAHRSVFIQLSKPNYQRDWHQQVSDYIEANRWEIINELLHLLSSEGPIMETDATRWGAWEKAVLSKVNNPGSVCSIIKSRMNDADDDLNSGIEFVEQIKHLPRYSQASTTQNGLLSISQQTMREQLNQFLGVKIAANTVTKHIQQMGLECLIQISRKGRERYWLLNPSGDPITEELRLGALGMLQPKADSDESAEEPTEFDEDIEAETDDPHDDSGSEEA
jgi:hypothetical protein